MKEPKPEWGPELRDIAEKIWIRDNDLVSEGLARSAECHRRLSVLLKDVADHYFPQEEG